MKLKKSKNNNNNQSPSDSAGSSTVLKICKQVSQIYDWLDSQIKPLNAECSACGKCCDFDSFGHKLFVTTPEVFYFFANVKSIKTQQSPSDSAGRPPKSCPYLKDNKCAARDFRFAGCRIFFCKADSEKINKLSEQAIGKFKALCDEYNFPYRYVDLASALNSPELLKLIER